MCNVLLSTEGLARVDGSGILSFVFDDGCELVALDQSKLLESIN
jgi:hypothetical protein